MKSILPEKERVTKPIIVNKTTCVNIPIIGKRDPRGADNNVRVWLDEKDQLHIRVEKTDRCYQYKETITEEGYVEIVAN